MAKKPKVNEEQVPRIRDQDFMSIYANAIGIIQSPFDIQLLFSHVQLQPEKTSAVGKVIVDRAIVAMSPQQAKALNTLLSDTLKQWETANGEIKTQTQTQIKIPV